MRRSNATPLKRPRITGVAHMALFVKDVEESRKFYNKLLGYEEPFALTEPDGKLALTFVKVNERQYIELFPEREAGSDRLNHISIETDDAEQMRQYLASKGVKVPQSVGKGRIGNANFNIKDPEGHTVEIVQYLPSGWSLRDKGKAMPETRISDRMLHVGIIVNSLEPQMKFYREILGFEEIWRGSSKGTVLSWVSMKVPDGDDYVEFMLYDLVPPGTSAEEHTISVCRCLRWKSRWQRCKVESARPRIRDRWRFEPERTGSGNSISSIPMGHGSS
ncbi:MAG: VOC family protein [Bryobacteraceae bacterium]